jgi:hypothetical protein
VIFDFRFLIGDLNSSAGGEAVTGGGGLNRQSKI